MSKILVTGGAGAIGSNLVRTLLNMKNEVIVIDDLSSGYQDNLETTALFVSGSILNDELLESIFREHNIQYVFHIAALFANQNSVEHPEKDLQTNGLGTLKVLEMSRKYGVEKFIYTSSSCVYGNATLMKEEDPLSLNLDTPYAITKLLGEQYCRFYSSFHSLNTVIVRLFNSYGPGEKPGIYRNVIPNFFYKAMRGESLIITGTGKETRDFTYVGDIMEGIILAWKSQTISGDIFNLGSGISTEIQQLVNEINYITGNKAPIVHHERRNWDHVLQRTANITKAKTILGYQPRTTLQDGLKKTYDWLLTNV